MDARTYTVLLQSFESKLRNGELKLGDRLPGERDLARQYGISRASVREGLQVLNALGLIRSGTGSGPRAGSVVISQPSQALSWALRMHLATRAFPVADVVATRILLEGQAARQAALQDDSARDETALLRAQAYVDELDDPNLSNARFHFCDAKFHYEISSLAGNLALKTVIDALHLATVSYVEEAVPRLPDWPATKVDLQEQHRQILAAVIDRDPDAAQQRVVDHISWFYSLIR